MCLRSLSPVSSGGGSSPDKIRAVGVKTYVFSYYFEIGFDDAIIGRLTSVEKPPRCVVLWLRNGDGTLKKHRLRNNNCRIIYIAVTNTR